MAELLPPHEHMRAAVRASYDAVSAMLEAETHLYCEEDVRYWERYLLRAADRHVAMLQMHDATRAAPPDMD